MSPKLATAVKPYVLWIASLVGVFILYALSLGPVLRRFDTAHAPEGYKSLPSVVRLIYYPPQNVPWPAFYSWYVVAVSQPVNKSYLPAEAGRAAWPKTIDEAVTRLLSGMNDEDKARVRDTKKEDWVLFHHGWGTGIGNEFGLWRGNTNLMTACHADHPDDASMVVIEAVWKRTGRTERRDSVSVAFRGSVSWSPNCF